MTFHGSWSQPSPIGMALSEDRFIYSPNPVGECWSSFSLLKRPFLWGYGMLWLTHEFWTASAISRTAFQPACRWMEALRRSGGTPNQGCFLAILMALCKKNRMTEAEWTVQETAGWLRNGKDMAGWRWSLRLGKDRAVTWCHLVNPVRKHQFQWKNGDVGYITTKNPGTSCFFSDGSQRSTRRWCVSSQAPACRPGLSQKGAGQVVPSAAKTCGF